MPHCLEIPLVWPIPVKTTHLFSCYKLSCNDIFLSFASLSDLKSPYSQFISCSIKYSHEVKLSEFSFQILKATIHKEDTVFMKIYVPETSVTFTKQKL